MKLLHRALLLICCLAAYPTSANDDLPVLGDPTAALMSADQEYRLGRAWLRQLRGQTSIMSDPLVQEYAESLVYQLASFSDLKEPDLDIVVINSRQINAFAVPGGVIGLNAGLFLNAHSEDEVGGVVAHEIAHVSQRHFARRYLDSKKVNTAVLAAMLASLAIAIAGDGEAGFAGMAAGAHVFGIGAIGGMTVAVMMRATMGHTGRPLAAGRALTVAFGLVIAAAVFRVAGPALSLGDVDGVDLSAVLWTFGFAVLAWNIGPWLAGPKLGRKKPTPTPVRSERVCVGAASPRS